MENINFKASLVAPDPNEVVYWIDLKEDKLGKVIKVYNADVQKWEMSINSQVEDLLDYLMDEYRSDISSRISDLRSLLNDVAREIREEIQLVSLAIINLVLNASINPLHHRIELLEEKVAALHPATK